MSIHTWSDAHMGSCLVGIRGSLPRSKVAGCVAPPSCVKVKNVLPLYGVYKKEKVKGTLTQALRLCTGRTACRWSRGIALLSLDHGIRRG